MVRVTRTRIYVSSSTLLDYMGAYDNFKYNMGVYIDVYSKSRDADVASNYRLAVTHPHNDVFLNVRDRIYMMHPSDACKPNETKFVLVKPMPPSGTIVSMCTTINPERIVDSPSVYHKRLNFSRDFSLSSDKISNPPDILVRLGYFNDEPTKASGQRDDRGH